MHERRPGHIVTPPSQHAISRRRSRRPKRGPVLATARADHIAAASATHSARSRLYRSDRNWGRRCPSVHLQALYRPARAAAHAGHTGVAIAIGRGWLGGWGGSRGGEEGVRMVGTG